MKCNFFDDSITFVSCVLIRWEKKNSAYYYCINKLKQVKRGQLINDGINGFGFPHKLNQMNQQLQKQQNLELNLKEQQYI